MRSLAEIVLPVFKKIHVFVVFLVKFFCPQLNKMSLTEILFQLMH